ncbi:hypothetical protein L195_g064480, partial [Trifolium pratense]
MLNLMKLKKSCSWLKKLKQFKAAMTI